jgi:hypothetical protein
VYDGTRDADVALHDNRIAGDSLTDDYASALFNDKDAGDGKLVTVSGIHITGHDAGNYCLTSTTATDCADIDRRNLTVTASASDKVYDGEIDAIVTLHDNRIHGDNLTDSYDTASFEDKNAGDHKLVTVSGISISGHDAGNYNLTNTTATDCAEIDKRNLTVTASANNKVYDGEIDATVTFLDNRLGDDELNYSYEAFFDDKNVGNDKLVTVSGISISGDDAGNYNLASTTHHHHHGEDSCHSTDDTTAAYYADITPRVLTVSATGINKVYDGNTIATVTLSDDRVAGDTLDDSYVNAFFDDKNVGTDKLVSVSGISISGFDAGNYSLLNDTAATIADITKRGLTVTAAGIDKAYDGNAVAEVTLSDDRVAGDTLDDSYVNAFFDDKNVGTDKLVSVSGISISGFDAGNYELLNDTASTTASIIPGGFFYLRNLQQQRFKMPELEKILPNQIHTFDMISSYDFAGSTYAYHPLTETDMSAFGEFDMEEGAYEFIGGGINIRGHEGLLPLLEEIKKKKKI